MVEFVYYGAEWCQPCKIYWRSLAWSAELDTKITKVDLSDGFIDDIQSVPALDIIVDGVRRGRVTQWGPGTRRRVLDVING